MNVQDIAWQNYLQKFSGSIQYIRWKKEYGYESDREDHNIKQYIKENDVVRERFIVFILHAPSRLNIEEIKKWVENNSGNIFWVIISLHEPGKHMKPAPESQLIHYCDYPCILPTISGSPFTNGTRMDAFLTRLAELSRQPLDLISRELRDPNFWRGLKRQSISPDERERIEHLYAAWLVTKSPSTAAREQILTSTWWAYFKAKLKTYNVDCEQSADGLAEELRLKLSQIATLPPEVGHNLSSGSNEQ